MAIAVAAMVGDPGWTDILTAVGTVGAVVAAVGIALWSDWRTRTQLADERRRALEQEQLGEAYLVQVVSAYQHVGAAPDRGADVKGAVRVLAAMVINHGRYTMTGVEAQFVLRAASGLVRPQRSVSVPSIDDLHAEMRGGWAASAGYATEDVLTPQGGIRFESAAVPEHALGNPFPVVRWTDRWGQRWEHRRGVVQRIREDEPWEP